MGIDPGGAAPCRAARVGLAVQLLDGVDPGAGDGLVGGEDHELRPTRGAGSAQRDDHASIVEQLGLAMIPLGWSAAVSGLTSGTTSGTSGSIRQAEELSITIAPARGELRSPTPARRLTGGEDRDVEARDVGAVHQGPDGLGGPVELAPGAALRGERDDGARREPALAQDREHGLAHGPVAPTTAMRCPSLTPSLRTAARAPRRPRPARRPSAAPAPRRLDVLGTDHARDLDRRGGDHLDVDALAAQRPEDLGGHAGVRLHAGADDRDDAHVRVRAHVGERSPRASARARRPSRGCRRAGP